MAKFKKLAVLIGLSFCFCLIPNVLTTQAFSSQENAFFDESDPSRIAYNQQVETKLVNVGRAPFALASPKFDCNGFIRSLENLDFLHVAWLFNTFGTDYRCLTRLLDDQRLITLQTNLINEPGHRNRRLERHEFLFSVKTPKEYDRLLRAKNASLKRRFDRYVKPLQDLLASRLQPRTECIINPGLESNVSPQAGKVLVSWAREAFPYCKIVWNPIAKAGTTQGTGANLVEQHGWFPVFSTHNCTFNNDGSDINFPGRKAASAIKHEKNPASPKDYLNAGNALQSALEEYANQCKVIYVWTAEDNCFDYNKQTAPWMPPLKRGCKNGPVNGLVAKEVETVHRNGVRAPKTSEYSELEESSFRGCSVIRSPKDGAKSGFLLKQSEFSKRGGVILTPRILNNARRITIVHRGRIIDTYQRSGIFSKDSDGRGLWRSSKSPLSYPLKVAIKIERGSETICYRVDNPRIRND